MNPPWNSCQSYVKKSNSVKGLKIADIADMAGLGFEKEMEAVCSKTTFDLIKESANVSEINFDISHGRKAYLTMRAEWMVGQQFERLDQIEKFGNNLASNVQSGLLVTALQAAQAQVVRNEIYIFNYDGRLASGLSTCWKKQEGFTYWSPGHRPEI
jgi:amidase